MKIMSTENWGTSHSILGAILGWSLQGLSTMTHETLSALSLILSILVSLGTLAQVIKTFLPRKNKSNKK